MQVYASPFGMDEDEDSGNVVVGRGTSTTISSVSRWTTETTDGRTRGSVSGGRNPNYDGPRPMRRPNESNASAVARGAGPAVGPRPVIHIPPRGTVALRSDSSSPAPNEREGGGLDGEGGEDTPLAGNDDATDEILPERRQRPPSASTLRQRRHAVRNLDRRAASPPSNLSTDGEKAPPLPPSPGTDDSPESASAKAVARRSSPHQHRHHRSTVGRPVRRVRHAEVVLVDRAVVAYGRYWLRLRWPGPQGGFGGYVALGKVPWTVGGAGTGVVGGGGELAVTVPSSVVPLPAMASPSVSASGVAMAAAAAALAEEVAGKNRRGGEDFHPVGEGEGEGIAPEVDEEELLRPIIGVPSSSDNLTDELAVIVAQHAPGWELLSQAGGGAGGGPPFCAETNLYYPTCMAMRLLAVYDDGLGAGEMNGLNEEDGAKDGTEASLDQGEPVFCRICREGLHDVNYDLETVAPPPPDPGTSRRRGRDGNEERGGGAPAEVDAGTVPPLPFSANAGATATREQPPPPSDSSQSSLAQGTDGNEAASSLIVHHPTAENPLLAPCSCTGSMAFVHYLCIEQWRCRSRHPAAKNGLRCETCGADYTLPPPPSRPASSRGGGNAAAFGANNPGGAGGDDEWLDAMPAHVLAALRRPHPWWQLGAAAVRRRWLRPFVPVFVSPLVALYCRARRTLKKRGVSRRRWACSLCRRRARWKCVRCLRSYYCSRQCQNVSWHIVHKHVCYKPARFWWSVVVYSAALVVAVPGVLKDPLVYDLMLSFLPVNFMVMGILGGGIATVSKRFAAVDIRGRVLEMIVVLLTLWLTAVTWGLVRGFFGDASQCWGVLSVLPKGIPDWASVSETVAEADGTMGETLVSSTDETSPLEGGSDVDAPLFRFVVSFAVDVLLRSTRTWFVIWDDLASKTGYFANRWICTPNDEGSSDWATVGCFPSVRRINPDFYLSGEDGESCVADMKLIGSLWALANVFLIVGAADRHRRGRRQRGRHAVNERRPHQD